MFKLHDVTRLLSAAGLSVGLLVGCGLTDEKPSVTVQDPVQPIEQPALAPSKEGFSEALKSLQYGRVARARTQLQAYLLYAPGNASAQDLLNQIDTPSAAYFPSDYFTVKLKSGQSLSTLSKRYLGTVYKFYALAKYNNIRNPSQVYAGQTIKIPATKRAIARRKVNPDVRPARVVKQTTQSEKTAANSDDIAVDPEEVTPVEEIPVVIEEVPVVEEVQVAEEDPVSADSLSTTIAGLFEQGDYPLAYEKLAQLRSLGPLTGSDRLLAIDTLTAYGNQIAGSNPVAAAASFTDAGQMHLMNGNDFKALASFNRAAELDSGNNEAIGNKQQLQQELTDKYHREASSAFRRQDLDEAIDKWNIVLQIDPDHASARAYLAQAQELKDRLKNIKQ